MEPSAAESQPKAVGTTKDTKKTGRVATDETQRGTAGTKAENHESNESCKGRTADSANVADMDSRQRKESRKRESTKSDWNGRQKFAHGAKKWNDCITDWTDETGSAQIRRRSHMQNATEGVPHSAGYFALAFGWGLGSRLASRSAGVILDSMPPGGTSALASQTRALRMVLR